MMRAQRGFALVAAIILIVVVAGLAAFAVSIVSGQSATQNLERMSRVTDLAAQAGLEWGAYLVMRPVAAPPCPSATTLTLPGSLSAVPVSVACSLTTAIEGAATVSIYQITATARYSILNDPDYVERTRTELFSR
jgi:MSHA biogenesis protein MshP